MKTDIWNQLKSCKICFGWFIPKGKQRTCSDDCSAENRRIIHRAASQKWSTTKRKLPENLEKARQRRMTPEFRQKAAARMRQFLIKNPEYKSRQQARHRRYMHEKFQDASYRAAHNQSQRLLQKRMKQTADGRAKLQKYAREYKRRKYSRDPRFRNHRVQYGRARHAKIRATKTLFTVIHQIQQIKKDLA